MNERTILSLIQPTGELHLGNYFGAIKNWIELQNSNKYSCIYGIADYHSLTTSLNAKNLKSNTRAIMFDLLACGIDLEKSVLFVQSLVPEHVELYWILGCLASFGELKRMTQFKDKSLFIGEKNQNISLGLFSYPVLQAADILIYKSDYVPVGEDQLQHLELTRNIAKKFNNQFGNYFPIPEPMLTKSSKIMSLVDPLKKMSKSLGNKHYIGIFDDDEIIINKIKSAVTDSGEKRDEISPGVDNLLELLLAMDKHEEHEYFLSEYQKGSIKYNDFKNYISESIIQLTFPFKEKKREILANAETYMKKIEEHSENNRKLAQKNLIEIRELVGLTKRK